jgi:RHS repeat-associated protein
MPLPADRAVGSATSAEYLNDKQNHTGYSQVIEERADDGSQVRVTTYTIGHDVIAQFSAAVGALVLLTDAHGSTRAVANAAAQIQQEYLYDAYGSLLNMQPANALTSLLYSGEQFNPVAGLQYLRARWYDPQSGRFTRMDPYSGNIRDPLGLHKYTYANGNPVMGVDPTGLTSLVEISVVLTVVGILGSAVIGAASGGWQGAIGGAFGASVTAGLLALFAPTGPIGWAICGAIGSGAGTALKLLLQGKILTLRGAVEVATSAALGFLLGYAIWIKAVGPIEKALEESLTLVFMRFATTLSSGITQGAAEIVASAPWAALEGGGGVLRRHIEDIYKWLTE